MSKVSKAQAELAVEHKSIEFYSALTEAARDELQRRAAAPQADACRYAPGCTAHCPGRGGFQTFRLRC